MIQITDKIELISTEMLKPYIYNNKVHPENQVEKIAKSIKKFGFNNPIIIDKDYSIIAGHGRLLAAQKLDMDKVPCLILNDLSPEEIRAFRIMDNKSAVSEWDFDAIAKELAELKELNIDLSITGFESEEIEDILKDYSDMSIQSEIQEIPSTSTEETIQTDIQEGDIIKIGRHTLVCGDSTNPDHVKTMMEGKIADLLYTDPPYGVSYVGAIIPGAKRWEEIANDELREDGLFQFLFAAFANMTEHLDPEAASYIYYASSNHIEFENALKAAGYEVKQQLIWNKGMVLGHSHYHWAHEAILYCMMKGSRTNWYGDRTNKTILGDRRTELGLLDKNELLKIIDVMMQNQTVWEIDRDNVSSYQHPTQKPVRLAARAIHNSTKEDMLVVDIFLGAGAAMLAAEQMGRECRGMELNPKYCQITIERMKILNPAITVECVNRDLKL